MCIRDSTSTVYCESCRLLDLVDTDDVSLSQVGAVAIDECDKMLSLGFAQELTRIRALVLEPPAGGAAGAPCVATSSSARCVESLLDAKVPAGAVSSGGEEQTATKKSKSKKRQKRLEGGCAKSFISRIDTWGYNLQDFVPIGLFL